MNAPANISIAAARLPATYEAAVDALAQCSSIDECKDWSDMAEAVASYAKQAEDESLFRYATRIRARAVRRVGEILQSIEASKGGRPPKNAPDHATRCC